MHNTDDLYARSSEPVKHDIAAYRKHAQLFIDVFARCTRFRKVSQNVDSVGNLVEQAICSSRVIERDIKPDFKEIGFGGRRAND